MVDAVESRILARARDLFAASGYAGTSVRAITSAARANLGAVTYYFGSKRDLYEAVLGEEVVPLREAVAAQARGPGTPLERIEGIIRTFFAHLQEHRALPRLIVQQLATSSDIPDVARSALISNHRMIAGVIAEGQADGSIRPGDPRLMALSIGSQPMMLSLMRDVLTRAVDIDQSDPQTRAALVDSVVTFAMASLRATPS